MLALFLFGLFKMYRSGLQTSYPTHRRITQTNIAVTDRFGRVIGEADTLTTSEYRKVNYGRGEEE